MGNVSGVSGSAGVFGAGSVDLSGLSPDAIIGFCESQLNNYGGQLTDLINSQKQQMADQQTVGTLKSQLEQIGTPKSGADLQSAYNDYQTAINALPAGDPVRNQLTAACASMCTTCNFNPNQASVTTQGPFQGIGAGIFIAPSESQWQGTVDAVGQISDNINSNSQIQMLKINQLSSMDQTAVEQAIQLMSKTDSTLLDEAKNA